VGALLEAHFMIRTFVKSPAPPPASKQAASASPPPAPAGRSGVGLPVDAEGR
jgi:hypothetical protein